MMIRYGAPPKALKESFAYLLGAVRREGRGSYLDVTVHADVAGRPAGARALAEILEPVPPHRTASSRRAARSSSCSSGSSTGTDPDAAGRQAAAQRGEKGGDSEASRPSLMAATIALAREEVTLPVAPAVAL